MTLNVNFHPFDSHEIRKVDVFAIHLAHSRIGVKKVEKEGQQERPHRP